jgi:hypothetical protein
MYAEEVTARRIANYERSEGTALRFVPIPRVRELVNYLEGHRNPARPKHFIRPALTSEFRTFIANERAMCKSSFLYWAERYAFIQISGGDGGIGLFTPWESQYLLLRKLAASEFHMWERRDAGDPGFDGICFLIHKARQLGFTMLCQLLLLHRATLYSNYRTLSASLDDQKTQLMHNRWSIAYAALPYWLKPDISTQSIDRGKWLSNGSRIVLQDFSQQSGLGQGEQWDCWHMTEIAAIPDQYYSEHIQNHLHQTLTNSMRGLALEESTSQGMGNAWHRNTELARRGELGRWSYAFIPWYAERTKNARYDIPVDWSPDVDTLAHAKKIESTSPEWMGYAYTPTRPQLYFYETEREAKRRDGEYKTFLVNFCATPEESFQHSGRGAFNEEVIQILRDEASIRRPVAYELGTPRIDLSLRNYDHGIRRVANHDLIPVHMTQRDNSDPRGLLIVYDQPRPDIWYSVGGDPAEGIPGWHRISRTSLKEELQKDNSALETWYCDPDTGLTRQAAEYAGPLTPREFATYCNVMCRLYGGLNGAEMGAPLILEIHPGPGAQVQVRLQTELNFSNFFRWTVFNGMEVKATNSWGFYSSPKAVRELWIKMRELVENRETLPVRPASTFLMDEMQYAVWDFTRSRGLAMEGYHDDRISATAFALWQLHDWAVPRPVAVPRKAAQAILPNCSPRCAPDRHDRQCANLPPDQWDWTERDITTLDQLSTEWDRWVEARMGRFGSN